ncbi:MAG: gliding motility-associated C-terminal domain-containing protein [Bacteroidales bacterium]
MKNNKGKKRSIQLLLIIAVILSGFPFHSNAQVSATVQAVTLTLTKISNGIARLDWTTQAGSYELIRTDPSGNSDTIFRGTDLTYLDTIKAPPLTYCNSTNLSYRIEISGVPGSSSNVVTGAFWDDTKPVDATLDSISFDAQGHPIVAWIPSPSADVAGYEIQEEFAGGVWNKIGFAPGNLISFFTADTINDCSIKTFAIITLDQCGNKSTGVGTYPNALNTLKLEDLNVDECNGTAVLSWNAYENMKPSFGEYQIYRKEDISTYTLIGTTSENTTTFTDTQGFIPGFDYLYFVRAVNVNGEKSSSSCPVLYTSTNPPNPDTVSMNFVSVVNNQYVEIGIHFGPPETVNSLRVYRATSPSGPYTLLDSIFPGTLPDIPFSDLNASVNKESYYYQIRALNSCKLETLLSDLSRTIFLTCTANADQSNTLNWNEYEGWVNLDHYEVNRNVNGVSDPANPISTTLPGTTTYSDPPSATLQTGDILSYYVTAFEGNVAVPDSSVSNTVQALRQPIIMMPNAFVPQGLNNIFRPVMEFVDEANYQLLIYNKWGQQVFISDNINLGWNGKYKGKYAPSGIYFYRLQYSSFTGETFSQTGSLVLVE